MKKYYEVKPFEYGNPPKNTEDEFFGHGWSVRRIEGKYIFSFISGSLSGRLKEVEISREDFESARCEQIGFDDLCIKYQVS